VSVSVGSPDPQAPSARAAAPTAGPRSLSICKVWDGDYPWDVRAEKICVALTAAGHRVHLVARNRTRRPVREARPEATVHRLRPWSWAPAWLDGASMFPAFFNPRWIGRLAEVARETHADVILCRDLPLAIPSIRVARRLRIPVVLDMAENYPAMLRSRRATGRTRLSDVLIRNATLARRVEEWVLPRLDGLFVVVEESQDRLVAMGAPADRIAVVGNTPPVSRLDDPTARPDEQLPLRLVYLGLLELQRGLATVLDALALLVRDGFPVRLDVYGGGCDEHILREHAARLGLAAPAVTFHGWVPNEVALARLPLAHVGLIPHWKDESWDTTIPNKLFDYMAAGLPVISSSAAPAARIVRTTGAGLVHRDRDAADLAAAVRALADPDVRSAAAAAGRRAIRETYHWERDVERMLALLGVVTRP